MGTVYSAYVTKIRADLSDPSATLISDADIQRHIDHAASDLSLVAPIAKMITVATTIGSRTIDLTTALSGYNLVRVLAVEHKVAFPRKFVPWSLFGFTLTLLEDSAPTGIDTVNVYCRVAMVVTSSSGTSTVPGEYDELITRRACAYAAQELATSKMNTLNIGGPVVWEHYLTLSQSLLDHTDIWLGMLAAKPIFFAGRVHAPMYPPPTWTFAEANPPEEVFP